MPSPKEDNIEKIRKEWQKLTDDDYAQTFQQIPEEVKKAMGLYHKFRINNFLENNPAAKELTNELIEKLKDIWVYCIIWGYIFGLADLKNRR